MTNILKEEQKDFYKKLGKFINICDIQYKADCVRNDVEVENGYEKYFSKIMFDHYKMGKFKISLFYLKKLTQTYKISMQEFIGKFENYLESKSDGKNIQS